MHRHTSTGHEGQSLYGFGILVLTLWTVLVLFMMQDLLCSCILNHKRIKDIRNKYDVSRLKHRRPTLFRDLAV